MSFGWEGEKTRLVPLDAAKHLDNAVLWLNDPVTTQWLLIGDRPLTRLAEEDYFQNAAKEDRTEVSFAIELLTGEHVGFCGLNEIQWQHGVAKSGTVIGPANRRGQGLGTDAVRTRTRYAFDVLGLRLLRTEVFADNTASHKTLLRCGYREYGRLPQRYWKRGKYCDVIYLWADRESFGAAMPVSGK